MVSSSWYGPSQGIYVYQRICEQSSIQVYIVYIRIDMMMMIDEPSTINWWTWMLLTCIMMYMYRNLRWGICLQDLPYNWTCIQLAIMHGMLSKHVENWEVDGKLLAKSHAYGLCGQSDPSLIMWFQPSSQAIVADNECRFININIFDLIGQSIKISLMRLCCMNQDGIKDVKKLTVYMRAYFNDSNVCMSSCYSQNDWNPNMNIKLSIQMIITKDSEATLSK